MKRKKRKRVTADWKIQGGLCLRVSIYWFACYLATTVTIFGFACLEGPTSSTSSITRFFIPAFVVATLVLPLALLDLLVFSNRFAGPLLNFRRHFADLAAGKETREIRLRQGDYLNDISENYNKILQQIQLNNQQIEIQNSNRENEVTV